MKHNCLLILLLLASTSAFGQPEKLLRIIGPDVIALAPKKTHASGSDSILVSKNEFRYALTPSLPGIKAESYRFLKADYVTVGDYAAFQADVIDSTAREQIYQGLEEDDDAFQYLNADRKSPVYLNNFNPGDRLFNRQHFPLDRTRRFSYDDPHIWPLTACMLVPAADRFYGLESFEQQRLFYLYGETPDQKNGSIVPVGRNYFVWAKRSTHERDVWSALAQLYETQTDSPVTGISSDQAKAFCHWKQEQLQRQIDREGLHFRVVVTLPESSDPGSRTAGEPVFTVPQRDYTEHWKITGAEYARFTAAVRDSLLREYLYLHLEDDEKAARYLDTRDKQRYYRATVGMEMVAYEPAQRRLNRWVYPLNYASPIQKDEETAELIRTFQASSESINCSYSYSFVDAKFRADSSRWRQDKLSEDLAVFQQTIVTRSSGFRRERADPYMGEGRFIRWDSVAVTPKNAVGTDNFMRNISYRQAMAFWHWKYRVHARSEDSDWQDYVLPDATQFEALRRDERVVVPEMKVPYPSPLFRYVIHAFLKS